MFFTAKKEEASAVTQFKHSCTYRGLAVRLSLRALNGLKAVALAEQKGEEPVLLESVTYVLHRRGMIRIAPDGEVILTQIGILALALAEAGDLITLRAVKEKA